MQGLEEVKSKARLAVAAALRRPLLSPPAPPTAPAAEGLENVVQAHARKAAAAAEDVAEVERRPLPGLTAPAGAGKARAGSGGRSGMAVLVVQLPLLGVGKNVVGLGGFGELLGRAGGLVGVRVILARKLAIGRLDLVGRGVSLDSQNAVIIPLGHEPHSTSRAGGSPEATGPAPAWCNTPNILWIVVR